MRGQFGGIEVVTVEQGAVDRCLGGKGIEPSGQIGVVHLHSRQRPHGGLHGLGSKHIGRVGRTHDVVNAPPVGDANDRPHVAGILHSVECQTEVAGGRCEQDIGVGVDGLRLFEDGQHALRSALVRHTRQLVGRDIDALHHV